MILTSAGPPRPSKPQRMIPVVLGGIPISNRGIESARFNGRQGKLNQVCNVPPAG